MSFTSRLAAAAARGYGMFRLAAGAVVDPFFNYVTALLHGDGTNGAQNNTFLDSSTNNFTITRNGNTTQGTFSPFSQTGWSAYFDGNGDYINFTNQGTTSSFTCECWFYRGENVGGYNIIFGGSNATSANPNNVQFPVYNDGSVALVLGGSAVVGASGTNVAKNQWNHIAWVRSGTSCAIFVNGVRVGTGTSSAALNVDRIGTAGGLGPGTYDALGYISNARITTTAVYDVAQTTCTVPTTPLTAISGTYLLTLQSNRFVDNSASPLTLTVNGNTSVQAFSPFNPTSAWSASSNGGSGYFDGSGDYLTGPANSTPLSFGTGDFTIESWVYPTSFTNANSTIFAAYGSTTGAYILYLPSSGYPNFYVYLSGGLNGNVFSNPSSRLALNAWSHVAVTRSSGVFRLFINGVVIDSFTNTTANINATTSNNSSVGAYFQAGMSLETTSPITGYLADVRVVKGTAVYTAAFTPPTAPLTAITNTSLLLNYTNAGIYDNAAVGNYETVGNAQVSTSVVKYGTGSMAFDGVGDYLVAPSRQTTSLTGDFTIEFWAYRNSGAFRGFTIGDDSGASGLSVYYSSGSAVWIVYNTNATRISGGSATVSIWQHIAVVRCAGIVKLYVNGTQVGSTWSSTATFSGALYIAAEYNAGTAYADTNGYIDDFRLTNGVCRYPYNFTPPTAAFPNIGGTVTPTSDQYFNYTTLLLPGNGTNGAQNNTFLDSSSNAFTITRNGNTTQGNFSPFSQTGWSNYFNGSSYLSTPNVVALPGNFTIETWVYYPGATSNGLYVGAINSSGYGYWCFYYNNSVNALRVVGTASATYIQSPSFTFPVNQWVHVAVTRSGTTVNWWVNGTSIGTTTDSTNWTGSAASTFVGSIDGTNQNVTAYLSNMRVVVGTAVYTSNFTPSIAPLAAVSGTWLLTCQSNRFVDNSSNAYALTSTGTSVQAFSPFAPTAAYSASTVGGSGYFDGSGDYLQLADSTAWDLTGDYTIEMWLYVTSTPSSPTFFQLGETSNYLLWYLASATKYLTLTGTAGITASTAMSLNAWNHVALVRNGSGTNNTVMYLNGVNVGQTTNNTSFTGSASNGVRIGAEYPSGFYVNGYISDVRVVKGTAVYTANFTPPTAPLTAITNTQLLLNYTNGGIVDATAKNDLETVGNAQISTTQSKFGGSSMAFDGTGDWLYTPSKSITTMGGDFTAEGWVYLSSTAAAWPVFTVGDSSGATGLELYRATSTGKWRVYSSNVSQIESSTSTSTGSWVHLAVVRYSGSVKLYVNGINEGSAWSTSSAFSGAVYVAAEYNTGSVTVSANGYIDDFRITLGIARYTSNFTPPTSAFLLQ